MNGIEYGWTLDFLDDPAEGLTFRFWSGRGDLTIGSGDDAVTYQGTNGVVDIDAPQESAGDGVRLTARMDATIPEVRTQLLRDIGPLLIKVRWIYNAGSGWLLSGKEFVGRLSAPKLEGGTYVVDVESLISDIDRGRVINWSDDYQKSRYPDDKGMEFLETYANGIDTKWPPL